MYMPFYHDAAREALTKNAWQRYSHEISRILEQMRETLHKCAKSRSESKRAKFFAPADPYYPTMISEEKNNYWSPWRSLQQTLLQLLNQQLGGVEAVVVGRRRARRSPSVGDPRRNLAHVSQTIGHLALWHRE